MKVDLGGWGAELGGRSATIRRIRVHPRPNRGLDRGNATEDLTEGQALQPRREKGLGDDPPGSSVFWKGIRDDAVPAWPALG